MCRPKRPEEMKGGNVQESVVGEIKRMHESEVGPIRYAITQCIFDVQRGM